MTPDPAIATAADYADAMITARRAKNALILLLILMLLIQLALFFVAKYTDVLSGIVPAAGASTTQPVGDAPLKIHYFSSGCMFLGVCFSIVLSFVLLLIVNIMLVGRLIGVARVTGAYIWSLILMVLVFPWQAFLSNTGVVGDFKIPGIFYTWSDLAMARFSNDPVPSAILKWARFVGFPLAAVVILLIIQTKSNRGMRQALGEEETVASTGETANA